MNKYVIIVVRDIREILYTLKEIKSLLVDILQKRKDVNPK